MTFEGQQILYIIWAFSVLLLRMFKHLQYFAYTAVAVVVVSLFEADVEISL
jgi:hypothetical protein